MATRKLEPRHARALPPWLTPMLPYRRYTVRVNGYEMHYVDQGEGPVVLLQHGNPTWCFLWRKVAARLLKNQVRVVIPDMIGLGLSDRVRHAGVHSLDFHADNLLALVRGLDLSDITIAGQDWGGPVSAVMAARAPARIHGAVFANTAIRQPAGAIRTTSFHHFANMPVISDVVFRGLNFPIPVMHRVQGHPSSIGRSERKAYRYPLRRWRNRQAPLALARMVPTDLSHPSVATLGESDAWARAFQGPVRLVWGRSDPILGGAIKGMRELFPDAPVTETDAGHFLQEEVPDELARAILEVVRADNNG